MRSRSQVNALSGWGGRRSVNDQIGELLVKENLLTADQLRQARDDARSKGERLGAQITQLGYLDEAELTDFVAKQYGVPSINLEEFEIDPAVIALVPYQTNGRHQARCPFTSIV